MDYLDLSQKIDVVFHCGAEVNSVAPYSGMLILSFLHCPLSLPVPLSLPLSLPVSLTYDLVLKKANVDGTKEMIKFALLRKMKYLFHISSLSVLDVHDGNGKVDEISMRALSKKLNNSSGYR